jgi:hypothetical protein
LPPLLVISSTPKFVKNSRPSSLEFANLSTDVIIIIADDSLSANFGNKDKTWFTVWSILKTYKCLRPLLTLLSFFLQTILNKSF